MSLGIDLLSTACDPPGRCGPPAGVGVLRGMSIGVYWRIRPQSVATRWPRGGSRGRQEGGSTVPARWGGGVRYDDGPGPPLLLPDRWHRDNSGRSASLEGLSCHAPGLAPLPHGPQSQARSAIARSVGDPTVTANPGAMQPAHAEPRFRRCVAMCRGTVDAVSALRRLPQSSHLPLADLELCPHPLATDPELAG